MGGLRSASFCSSGFSGAMDTMTPREKHLQVISLHGPDNGFTRRVRPTRIGAKGRNGRVSLRHIVEIPSLARFLVGALRALERHLILPSEGLAIEDKERCNLVLCPLVKADIEVV